MDVLIAGQQRLQEKGIESPRLECEMMMSQILGCQRHQLYIRGNEQLSQSLISEFNSMLERRLKGEPVQYILGTREFMGLDFNVDKRVLIPRWETEVLVEYALEALKQKPAPVHILDIGTGSGAIAVSMAVYLPGSKVTAVDISEAALTVACENAKHNKVTDQIDFLLGDLFCSLDIDKYAGYFDAVISNPPYIPANEIKGLMTEVKDYEPWSALDGGEDGLDYYRRIAAHAHVFLKDKGLIAVEMGYGQSRSVEDIFMSTGRYELAGIQKDLAGIQRVAAFHKR
jgi:release factor glutamine methyltransferase